MKRSQEFKTAKREAKCLCRMLEDIDAMLDDIRELSTDSRAVDPCQAEEDIAALATAEKIAKLSVARDAVAAAETATQEEMNALMALDTCRANIGVGMPEDPSMDDPPMEDPADPAAKIEP